MTDKATVEIPSPVAGKVVALGAEVGGVLAVGAELVRLEVAGEGDAEVAAAPREAVPPAAPPPATPLADTGAGNAKASALPAPPVAAAPVARAPLGPPRPPGEKPHRLACGAAARAGGRRRSAPGARHRAGRPDRP